MTRLYKQCPSCGEKSDRYIWEGPIVDESVTYFVHCIDCHFDTGLHATKEEAAKKWNLFERPKDMWERYQKAGDDISTIGIFLVLALAAGSHPYADIFARLTLACLVAGFFPHFLQGAVLFSKWIANKVIR